MSRTYLSTKTFGFFSEALHGTRTIVIADPSWTRPLIEVTDPNWMAGDDLSATAPMVLVPDLQAEPPVVEVANPNCLLPPAGELIELTDAQYQTLRDAAANGQKLLVGEDGVPFVCARPVPTAAELLVSLARQIDAAADAARSLVAGDPLRAVEYDRAASEAQAFAEAGYPANAVPRTVAAWAINGRTAQQAADSILVEAAAYTEALYVIRETRLAAKERIRTLMDAGEVEQAQQLAEQTIAVIEAAVAGVGNAAA